MPWVTKWSCPLRPGHPPHCPAPPPSRPSCVLHLQPLPAHTTRTPGPRPFPRHSRPQTSGAGLPPHTLHHSCPWPLFRLCSLHLGTPVSNATSSKKPSPRVAHHPQPDVVSPSLKIPAVLYPSPLGPSPIRSFLRYSSCLLWMLAPGPVNRGLGGRLLTLPCAGYPGWLLVTGSFNVL